MTGKSKTILVATWVDELNQPTSQEFYEGTIDPFSILTHFEICKRIFKKRIISGTDEYLMFSDGSKVSLQMHSLRGEKELEGSRKRIRNIQIEP